MKKRFSKILGVGLTVALLASLMLVAAPVSAGTLSWGTETIPSTSDNILEPGSMIVDIAIAADGTMWAAGGANLTYKSTDDGRTWSAKTTDNDTDLLAVAPDDSDIMAYADTTTGHVWITTDGGGGWGSLMSVKASDGANVSAIKDIAISPESGGIHYIAVAGEESGPIANVWYYNLGAAAASWSETNDLAGIDATSVNTTAAAVTFSPNFASDQVMAVVTSDDDNSVNTDYVRLELFSFNQKKWNDDAGFGSYGATIVSDDGITDLTSASITLDPEYLGSDDAMRMAFVGLTVAGDTAAVATSGIYRMDNTSSKALKAGSGYKTYSIAYNGANLVAGSYDSTAVFRCADPLATSPSVSSASTYVRPGGSGNTTVLWNDDEVAAATTGDESAFAVSSNDGKSFRDISLIDTTLNELRDVVVSADGSVVYLVTDNETGAGTDTSLWRKASSWERVLRITNTNAEFLVRLASDDSDIVYVARKSGTTVYYTTDGGTDRWQSRSSRSTVEDLAVEAGGEVAYVLTSAGKVSVSTNAGFTWGSASSVLNSGNMIVSLGEDKVLVGSNDGYVSYSTDGGSSWTKLNSQIGSTSGVTVVAANGLDDGDYVYAGLDTAAKGVYRWELGESSSWSTIYDSTTYGVDGIVLQGDALYVSAGVASVAANATDVLRTLSPMDSPSVTWSTANTTAKAFDVEPQGLRSSSGKLWAIDTISDKLYSYTDSLVDTGPVLITPASGTSVGVNSVTGYALDMAFSWEKPSSSVTAYQLKFYDADGYWTKTFTVSSTGSSPSAVVGHDTDNAYTLMPGTTYSWKVRVSSPLYSQYSESRTFSIEEAAAPVTEVTVEPTPAPEITVTPAPAPEVVVNVPPQPTPVTPAPAIPAYLLWTIIGIGAVLVIALIVLIVRTRRVV